MTGDAQSGGVGRSAVESDLEEEIGQPSSGGDTIQSLLQELKPYAYPNPVWHWSLGDSLPSELSAGSTTDAAVTWQPQRADITTSGGGNDNARVVFRRLEDIAFSRLMVLATASWTVQQANLAGYHSLGVVRRAGSVGAGRAAFNPHVGDAAAGNVHVNGTDGTLDYPDDLTAPHPYAVEVDRDAGETRFWVSQAPWGASPEETIAAIPDRGYPIGSKAYQSGDASSQELRLHQLTVVMVP
jgi:hypothetical protein